MDAPAESENTTIEDAETKEVAANLEFKSFKIDGMTCAMGCAKVIENKLADLDGVQDVRVDFEAETAVISYDSEKQNVESIAATVEKIADGAYKVSDMSDLEEIVDEKQS
ncbi:cation transporter [Flavobacterium litorale]|uniref:Cation transporter n=2 Tax=Flavobacterium litorale TaxID=2856519 RepID=A0ABX8VE75_9FLAO|nr:cation transporter [Flavobacterium litorale]